MPGYLKNKTKLILLFVIAIILWSSVGLTQNETRRKTIIRDGDTIVLQAIVLVNITENIELVNNDIKKIEKNSNPDDKIKSIDSLFLIAVSRLTEEKKNLKEDYNITTTRSLVDAYQQWTNYKNLLSEWQTLVSDYSITLSNNILKTKDLITIWELTLTDAKQENAPQGIILNIREVINKLTTLKNDLKTKSIDIYSKQSQITEITISIDETILSIEKLKNNLKKSYFKKDNPAIWNAYDSTFLEVFQTQTILRAVSESSKAIIIFYEANQDRFALHILLFIFLLILFYSLLNYTIKANSEDKSVIKSKKTLSNYFVVALIIALISTFWIYTTRQLIVDDIFQFLLLVLLLIFLPKITEGKIRSILYYSIGLHLVNQMQVILPSDLFIVRILLFAETAISFIILRLLLNKNGALVAEIKNTKLKFILVIAKIFYFALLIPLFANIFGFILLTNLINNVIINSIFNGFIIYVGLFIITNTFNLILKSDYVLLLNSVRKYQDKILKNSLKFFNILALLFWIRSLLSLFSSYDDFKKWLSNLFLISWKVGDIQIDVGSVLSFLLVIFITFLITNFIRTILEEEIFTRVKLPRGVPGAISMVIRYFIVGWGIIISINALGVDLSQFGLIAGALGVGIGFGLQNVVFNFIAGLILAFERPIQIGDTIETSTVMGNVKSIGVRSSTILTFEGSEVIVPNGNLISNDVTNWTLSDRRKRRDIFVGVEYGSDPHKVMEILRLAADKNINVLQNPKPWILFDGFGANSLDFRLRIWTSMDVGLTTKSEVTIAIYDGLKAAKINIPFPQQDLHIKSIEPEIKKIILKKD